MRHLQTISVIFADNSCILANKFNHLTKLWEKIDSGRNFIIHYSGVSACLLYHTPQPQIPSNMTNIYIPCDLGAAGPLFEGAQGGSGQGSG